jgi:hypothetical protein
MVGGKCGKLALRPGEVLEAQHRAAADRAALRRDVTLLQGRERQREARAFAAQRLDRLLHLLRLVGLQPCAEGEHAARHGGARDRRRIAGDFRLVGARGPHHDQLRLGVQQRDRAVTLLAQVVDLALPGGERLVGAPARAQQRDRRHHAEQDDTERQRQRSQLTPVKRRERVEIIRERLQRMLVRPRDVRREDGRPDGGAHGLESLAPRMRLSAPCPDRVRHFRAPARHRFGTRPKTPWRAPSATVPANRTLPSTGVEP